MLDKARGSIATARRAEPLDVAILSVATAVPPYVLSQADAAARALRVAPQFARLDGLYANTGIETRYVCETADWYLSPRTWEERTASFQRHAVDLLEEVAIASMAEAGLSID